MCTAVGLQLSLDYDNRVRNIRVCPDDCQQQYSGLNSTQFIVQTEVK
jgi:hypothetical protein